MIAGTDWEFSDIVYQKVLRQFGQMGRMDEYRLAGMVSIAEISGTRVRGARLGWMDIVQGYL